jgi:hypothetical protein
MGMGDIRTPQMRGGDQANTISGNPGLAYNMPRVNPQQMQAMQGQPVPNGFNGLQQPGGQQMAQAKPMRVRMPNFGQQLQNVQTVGGPNAVQQGQMQAQEGFQRPQQAQYHYPALASINNQGRRVFAQ